MPKISVLMPVYKTKEEYLRTAIESILNQTYKDFELLILDDCPEDSRENVIKSYNDKRITYYKNTTNLGITPSRNRLIDLAQGEYLAVMDHDDISMPERFAKEIEILDKHQDIGVVGSYIHKIVSAKDVILPKDDADIKTALMMKCAITHPAAMIRKEILVKHNIRYEEHYSPAEDYKLWCRLIDVTKFHNIPKVLLHYRDWKNNTTNKTTERMNRATYEIWAENKVNHPDLWEKFQAVQAKYVYTVRLFNFIPFLKIVKKGSRKKVLLFDFIPLYKVKKSVKL